MRTKLAALASAGVLAGAIVVLPASTAQAAATASYCWDMGFVTPHYPYEAFGCYNTPGTPVYGGTVSDPRGQVGTLIYGVNWFACRTDSGDYNGEAGGPHPYRWLWTQADNGAWGWVSDKNISSETNSVTAC